jgi:hypothetical protein
VQCKADDLPEAETAEILALSEMKSAMREAKKVWTKKQLAQAGAMVNAHVAMVALLHRLNLAQCHSHIGAGVRPDGERNAQERPSPRSPSACCTASPRTARRLSLRIGASGDVGRPVADELARGGKHEPKETFRSTSPAMTAWMRCSRRSEGSTPSLLPLAM